MAAMTGIVFKLKTDKGYGFLRPDQSRDEYFFHRDDCPGVFSELVEGQRVEFASVKSTKGLRASRVSLL